MADVLGPNAETTPSIAETVPASSAPADAPGVLRPVPASERYQRRVELGRGGMGRVVEAFDVQLGRTVAIKEVLPTITGTPRRFAREVQITARLEHPAIVPVYDAGLTEEGRPFYVMRRVSGRPLQELLNLAETLEARLVLLPAVLAAIDAIAHAHIHGVIHRDLKPANILVGALGETVVIDWGLAKVIGEPDEIEGIAELAAGDSLKTQLGLVFGTPGFMSPEQGRGEEIDARGDVYALGAILYQLLAGKPPHAGKSAAELLDSTQRHAISPLAIVSPNAPPDLVAIVEKALAFELGQRYANAVTLGEDVRRFLDGQLVAAHRYTTRQRVARFARRHRAALAVAALAVVTLSVLSGIGVHDIVIARDAAEAALVRSSERSDALIAARARSLLDSNPTQAVAVLKQVVSSPKLAGEIRAIASAAILRGVAWSLDGPDSIPLHVEMSAKGQALYTTIAGSLRIVDLDGRRLELTKAVDAYSVATWVGNGELVLVYNHKRPPYLLDPKTGAVIPLALPPISAALATLTGDRVVALDDQHRAVLIDVTTRTAATIPNHEKVTTAAIAPDGAWLVLVEPNRVSIVDRAGVEITGLDLAAGTVAVSQDTIMVSDLASPHLYEVHPLPGAPWVPLPTTSPNMAVQLLYRGTDLIAVWGGGNIDSWNGRRWARVTHLEDIKLPLLLAAHDTIVVTSNKGTLRYFMKAFTGELHPPSPLESVRYATNPGSSHLFAVGIGRVLDFDLESVLPHRLAMVPANESLFFDEDTLFIHGLMKEWGWYDLRTNTLRQFDVGLRALSLSGYDPSTGRVLVTQAEPVGRVLVFRKNDSKQQIVSEGAPNPIARMISGGPVVFGLSDGRILVTPDGGVPSEVVRLDGAIVGLSTIALHRFAALSSTGELVRGDLGSRRFERLRIPVHAAMTVVITPDDLLVAEEHELFAWRGAGLVKLATFDSVIASVNAVADGVLLELHDHSVVLLDAAGRRIPLLTSDNIAFSPTGRVLGGVTDAGLTIIDLDSRARWVLPIAANSIVLEHISPSARLVLALVHEETVFWKLPRFGSDLSAALDQVTNAIDAGEVLAWHP